jgi:hypothetical protein
MQLHECWRTANVFTPSDQGRASRKSSRHEALHTSLGQRPGSTFHTPALNAFIRMLGRCPSWNERPGAKIDDRTNAAESKLTFAIAQTRQ